MSIGFICFMTYFFIVRIKIQKGYAGKHLLWLISQLLIELYHLLTAAAIDKIII